MAPSHLVFPVHLISAVIFAHSHWWSAGYSQPAVYWYTPICSPPLHPDHPPHFPVSTDPWFIPSLCIYVFLKKHLSFSKTIWAHDATGTIAFNQFLWHDGVVEQQPEKYGIQCAVSWCILMCSFTAQAIHLTFNRQYIKAQLHGVLEKPNIDVDVYADELH